MTSDLLEVGTAPSAPPRQEVAPAEAAASSPQAGHSFSRWQPLLGPVRYYLASRLLVLSAALVAGLLYAVSVIGTTLSLLVVAAMGLHSLSAALVAVTLANGAASLVRFSLLRGWAYRPLRPQRASVAA